MAIVILELKLPSMNSTKVENGMLASGFVSVAVVGAADVCGRSISPKITATIRMLMMNMANVAKSKTL